ncbi:Nucleoside-diphosphate-sugar epimerase [Mucilaginibacter mallensis]|uniref:Nucleoside-diphosphate-sugar epimerase n=1 Tax=Mucilaginibacter mallensis TaxID=652787 RepID=A0A1H2ALN1_MUCMA|nr:NAD(P)-dependent oxidoreductase [Mucilaginibacter mallensis]SDT46945.1 Nucleoside-diphosphate-sugar epimerase [Mucilaginibacter mallensis]
MAKVFLTGITGFLGSNIAEFLISQGHNIVAVYRPVSSRVLCTAYIDKVEWILQAEDDEWVNKVIETKPDIIVHSAWLGVGHLERDNWDVQLLNIGFLQKLLSIASKAGIQKFIGLGSQAEYGTFNGCIDESHALNPVEAYGCVKIICTELIERYCNYYKIDWYWLRLFSFFGKGESEKWLIPSLVKKIILSDHMDFTEGNQKYSYLYVNDLGLAVNHIIEKKGRTGIYNISGKSLRTLKSLIESIRDKVDPSFKLNFGKLPYRANQSMHMQGDSSKFVSEFGDFDVSDFDDSMLKVIEYLKEKFNGEVI